MPRIIEVLVPLRGEPRIQTRGYAGTDCLAASKFLDESLGTPIAERKTPEYYQTDQQQQQEVQQ